MFGFVSALNSALQPVRPNSVPSGPWAPRASHKQPTTVTRWPWLGGELTRLQDEYSRLQILYAGLATGRRADPRPHRLLTSKIGGIQAMCVAWWIFTATRCCTQGYLHHTPCALHWHSRTLVPSHQQGAESAAPVSIAPPLPETSTAPLRTCPIWSCRAIPGWTAPCPRQATRMERPGGQQTCHREDRRFPEGRVTQRSRCPSEVWSRSASAWSAGQRKGRERDGPPHGRQPCTDAAEQCRGPGWRFLGRHCGEGPCQAGVWGAGTTMRRYGCLLDCYSKWIPSDAVHARLWVHPACALCSPSTLCSTCILQVTGPGEVYTPTPRQGPDPASRSAGEGGWAAGSSSPRQPQTRAARLQAQAWGELGGEYLLRVG